jgi:hypothetical protein
MGRVLKRRTLMLSIPRSVCSFALLFACASQEPAKAPQAAHVTFHAARAEPTPEASGPLPASTVAVALAQQRDEIGKCLTSSGFDGVLQTAWDVDATGNALQLRGIAGDVPDCLSQLVTTRHFETKGKSGTASWTFVRNLPLADGVRRPKHAPRHGSGRSGRQGARFDVPGRLDAAHVDDVVQGGFKMYATCFRQGLTHDQRLHGKLALRFTVAESGEVDRVEDAGSEFSDRSVTDCAAEAFYALRFNPPRGGKVKVTYLVYLNDD